MKLIRDQVKTIDAGSMVRHWGAISTNSHETFRNSYDVMKPCLLKSRDFGSLIRAPNHCFETIDSQKFQSFTKQCFKSTHHYVILSKYIIFQYIMFQSRSYRFE